MYPRIRDLLLYVMEQPSPRVLVDAGIDSARGIPDLILRAATGVVDTRGEPVLTDWAVFEVKDEPGVFRTARSREAIFTEKAKYIGVGTEWFVMIDPSCLIARPVVLGSQLVFDPSADIVVPWDGVTRETFANRLRFLHIDNAGLSASVKSFREGDESAIAVVKLQVAAPARLSRLQQQRLGNARRDFFDTVSWATALLQQACVSALAGQQEAIAEMRSRVGDFSRRWHGHELTFSPLRIKGRRVSGPDEAREHDGQAATLRRYLSQRMSLAKLALVWLPAFHDRMGATTRDDHFAIETANLVLARMLLIRFFEDHGFFGDNKYVCNGGVAAFQSLMSYFGEGYTELLRHAYAKAHHIYAYVFDEMDLDWVLGVRDQQLSRALELSMMWLSRFDFTTVRGDILTGIYDRFLDRAKRKALGEFYTPPSIARYMVDCLDIRAGDSTLDPACGSGTFLIEAYERIVGKEIESGRADFADARRALSHIAGIDINPFSAVVAQVQLLWHLLPMKEAILADGFPDLRISERINALLQNSIEMQGTLFDEINRPVHAAVIGNPPYVRPERSSTELTGPDAAAFAAIGSVDKNLYSLFLYKALRDWCRDGDEAAGLGPGKVAFVLPLSLCDSESNQSLRDLFKVGQRYRIVEIVDMDVIGDHVFDAKVVPIIFIAEKRAASANDRVRVRVAGPQCRTAGQERTFDLSLASDVSLPYSTVWSADGRILTKLTAERRRILDTVCAHPTLSSASQTFWTGKRGSTIVQWQLDPPPGMNAAGRTPDGLRWEQSDMIRMGCAFRGSRRAPPRGQEARAFDFFKGENIVVGAIEGDPVESGIDIEGIDDNSLWRFRDILPHRGVAFLQISLGLTAAGFDPRRMALLNTATLFFPNAQLQDFPFDLAFASRVYQWIYAIYLRCGAMSHGFRSHVYPSNLRLLPWPAALGPSGPEIEQLRPQFMSLCAAISNRGQAIRTILQGLPHHSLAQACRDSDAQILWSDSLRGGSAVTVDAPSTAATAVSKQEDGWMVLPAQDFEQHFVVADESIARRAAAALTYLHGKEAGRRALLDLPIPDAAALKEFVEQVASYDAGQGLARLDAVLDELDRIVGAALGLSDTDISFIQQEMQTDAFLRNIRPNLPHAGRRLRGLYESLASSNRYRSDA